MADWWTIIVGILGGMGTILLALPLFNQKVKNLISSILAFILDFLPVLQRKIQDKEPLTVEEMEDIQGNLIGIKDDILELRDSENKENLVEAKKEIATEGAYINWAEAKEIATISSKNTSIVAKVKTVGGKMKASLTKSETN